MILFIRWFVLVVIFCSSMAFGTERLESWPELRAPVGLPDPSLGFGLNGISDWSGVLPFVDVMKTARPWIGGMGGKWGGMKEEDLRAAGCLDSHGWPRCLPPGVDAIKGVFGWGVPEGPYRQDYRAGRYHVFYEGVGKMELRKVALVSETPGHIVFDLEEYPGNWWIEIYATGRGDGSDYLRNIRIVREQNVPLLEAGVLFDPQWLALVADARQVRFMDWSQINTSMVMDWHDTPSVGTYSWMNGVPLEVQVALANEIGADPWFNIPTRASDSYVREFSNYVRDHLDTRLVAYVEFGNEAWNHAFANTRYLIERGKADLGTSQVGEYYRKRASEVMQVWGAQFSPSEKSRFVRVLGGQTVNVWLSEILLEGDDWRWQDKRSWKPAGEVFDALGVTTYFGAKLWKEDGFRELLLNGAADSDFEALNALLLDEDVDSSIPFVINRLRDQRELANEYGLKLVVYEGGQHVHHYIKGVTDDPEILQALVAYVRSPEMAELYRLLWEQWQGIGDGPFMQFVEAAGVSKYGSWGGRLDPLDDPPRARLLDGLNAATPAWWVPKAGTQYQHGLAVSGSITAERLAGTEEEDTITAGDGDDVLRGGRGNDYLHGGAGNDVALFEGPCSNYRVVPVGNRRFLVQGLDGIDSVFSIETLLFGDDRSIDLGSDFDGKLLCVGSGG